MNLIKGFRLLRFLLLAAILLFPLSSCTTLPERGVKPDYTVAVLPINNATTDADGPVLVRRIFNEKIQIYYKTKPLDEVDRTLKDQLGITLGKQLDTITPQMLGEVLGVDGVIYGYLLNFDDITTVVYNVSKVRAGFKLVDTKDGSTIWARGKGLRRVTGAMDIGAISTSDYDPIKDAEGIAGINEWLYVRGDLLSLYVYLGVSVLTQGHYAPEDFFASEDVPLSQVLFTVFLGLNPIPFSAKAIGNALNVHLLGESTVVIDNIVKTIGAEQRHWVPNFAQTTRVPRHYFAQTTRVPRLFLPAYLVFAGKDFTALMTMTVVNQSSHESITRKIELAKFEGKLRSNRLSEEGKLSVLVKKDEKKGYILYPAENKYIEVSLAESDFKETGIAKEFIGEDNIDGQQCNKYKVRVTYGDGWVQDGSIWEAKNLNGLVVKVDLNDKDTRIIMELKDVSFKTPSAAIFEVPKGYTKIDY